MHTELVRLYNSTEPPVWLMYSCTIRHGRVLDYSDDVCTSRDRQISH